MHPPKKALTNLRLKLGPYITTTTIQLHTTCLIQNGLLDKYQTSLKDQIHNLFSMEVNKTHNHTMDGPSYIHGIIELKHINLTG
jgi:hypothetical protein